MKELVNPSVNIIELKEEYSWEEDKEFNYDIYDELSGEEKEEYK